MQIKACVSMQKYSSQSKEYVCKLIPLYYKLRDFIVILPVSSLLWRLFDPYNNDYIAVRANPKDGLNR